VTKKQIAGSHRKILVEEKAHQARVSATATVSKRERALAKAKAALMSSDF
jgi:hypothetical protein